MCVDARGLFKFWWIYQTCPVFVLIFGPAAKFVGSQFPNQGWNMGACSGSAESQPLDHQRSPTCPVLRNP